MPGQCRDGWSRRARWDLSPPRPRAGRARSSSAKNPSGFSPAGIGAEPAVPTTSPAVRCTWSRVPPRETSSRRRTTRWSFSASSRARITVVWRVPSNPIQGPRRQGERLSDIRVQQAAATGADILAVACPYCLQMFEDSVKTMDLPLEVKDVAELLAESL